jgi:RNA polymerase sigma-70 factor (ECF subfamily)
LRAVNNRPQVAIIFERGVSILTRNEFYEMIFNNHLDTIKAIVKSTIYSESLADIEDCVQNVLVAALQKQNLQEHPKVEGWLYITSRNLALQFNRDYFEEEKILNIDDFKPYTESFLNQLIEDIEFERLKEKDCINKMIKSLSKTEKHFFTLRYIEKYNNKQISEITGKSEVAIRVRYSRLKEKIEKFIKNM